jgi:hypothetical protein
LSDVAKVSESVLVFHLVTKVSGADAKGTGDVESVILMRGEVHRDRDSAVFDVSLHEDQYPFHFGRTRFFQVLEKELQSTEVHAVGPVAVGVWAC